jgi:hypothetical protein
MSALPVTPWFSGDVKPLRVGVYERDDTGTCMENGKPNFSMWDGLKWRSSRWEIAGADEERTPSYEQELPWRGLASDPSAP